MADLGKCYRCQEPSVVCVGIADPDCERYPACALHARAYQHMTMLLCSGYMRGGGEITDKKLHKVRKMADTLAAEDIRLGWKLPVRKEKDEDS